MKSGTHKKKIVLAPVGLCVVVLVAAAAFWPGEKEPEYNGKKLSEWLDKAYGSEENRQAVRALGKEAVPFLVKWIRRDQLFARRVRKVGRLPIWAQKSWPVKRWLGSVPSGEDSGRARLGFEILGPEGASAIPALHKIAEDQAPDANAFIACSSLAHLGPNALNPVLQVFKHALGPNRQIMAVSAFYQDGYGRGRFGTEVRHVPQSRNSENPFLADKASQALENFSCEPLPMAPLSPEMPKLGIWLRGGSADPELRLLVIAGLKDMGTNDTRVNWAIKIVSRACEDSDERVRIVATNTLNRIRGDRKNNFEAGNIHE